MTHTEINIAIATACGMREFKMGPSDRQWLKPKDGGGVTQVALPDFCNDLNAMHEAEKVLTKMGNLHWRAYASHLFDTVMEEKFNPEDSDSIIDSVLVVIDATAAQRAEAFLKTLNLWK